MANTIEHWEEGAPLFLLAANNEGGFGDTFFSNAEGFREFLHEWLNNMDEDDEAYKHYTSLLEEWESKDIAEEEFIYFDECWTPEVLPKEATSAGSLR